MNTRLRSQIGPMKILQKRLGILGAVTGVTGGIVAGAFALALFISGGNGPPSKAEALAFVQDIPEHINLQPGDVLHERIRAFERYGSKASDVAEATGVPTEERTYEFWQLVGPNGETAIRSYARTLDGSGNVVLETILESPDTFVTRKVPSNEIVQSAPYQALPVEDPHSAAEFIERSIEAGRGRAVSRTDSLLVFEHEEPVPDSQRNKGPSYVSSPYDADLNPVSWIYRMALRDDGVLLWSEEYAITESGESVLRARSEQVLTEVLDEFPEGLYSP